MPACHHWRVEVEHQRPLIGADGLRALLAGALGVSALVAVPAAWFLTIFGLPRELLSVTMLALLATPFAASAIVTGRWSSRRLLRAVQIGATVALLGAGLLLAGLGVLGVLDALATVDTLGTAPASAAPNAGIAAAAVVACALLLAAVPLPLGRRAAGALVCGVTVLAAGLALGCAALSVGPQGCGRFRFDRERWLADVPRGGSDETLTIAAALVRCDSLDGATRAEVRELLGRPHRGAPPSRTNWRWSVGTVNDAIGPGDGEELRVTFHGDRVRDAHLLYGT